MRWVVIGAGAAGSVVAARLAEAGEDVVVVEAGAGTVDEATTGASFFDAAAAPGRAFAGPFLRGRGIGGSSAINGMVATQGDAGQYRSWGWDDTDEALARVQVPMEPARDGELGPIDRALLAAAADAARPPLTRHGHRRVSAWDAYAPARHDIELRADALVTAVRFEGTRAAGVDLDDGTMIAADAVVLCAGAIGTPVILRHSGVDGPDVGAHLRNHAALAVELELRPGVDSDPHGLVAGTLLRRADLQLLAVNHLGPDAPGRAGLLVVAMEADGEGHVAADGTAHQVLSANDHRRLAAGVELVHELLDHPSFQRIVAEVTVGQPPEGVYHPTSTCRMGAVVDGDGAVSGRRDLFVADASIFPELPTANTYLPTLMLAERMVGRVLGRARRSW